MSAESPRHTRSGGPLTVPSQPPADRSLIDTVSGFINDVTLSTTPDPRDTILWARFETADINEPMPEGDGESESSPLLLVLGYGSGVQVWLIPPNGEAQEVLSWRQGTVRVLRILSTPAAGDCFVAKRPLIALCDSAGPPPAFCALSFISVRGGEQVKSIKFKNAILDVQANKHSVVVSFAERFAVFDAGSLEDRMAITTCYPCPCPLGGASPINPIALGDRWLAYADRKINPSKRSSGGCESEGVSSYTATVLHAAKSLSAGLRGLGESVAHSLAGRAQSQSPSPPTADQPGVITIIHIEGNTEDECQDNEEATEPIVAHFVAHSDAIIALKFDASGLLLVTADRRGHDFHVFRINPHPCGPSLASVHHLYILHRGDTTAKVQDIALSPDSRWAAISTLRGTTHVFPITPYGGPCGVRTHTQPRVVNRLSRFHRSAGLPHAGTVPVTETNSWFANPRVPPYPSPVLVSPLAQIRPTANIATHTITRNSCGRQRLSSLSEDSVPLLARARFCRGAWPRSHPALYLVTPSGNLLLHALHVRPAPNVPKEKVCDESGIEVEVEAVSRWPLQRPATAADLLAPLPHTSPLLQPHACPRCMDVGVSEEERWLSQVEIVTHAGPHRRLWMGPQFVFKTYNTTGSNSSLSEADTVEVDTSGHSLPRSNPVNMPGARPLVPVLIDSAASSLEHSPSESFRRKSVASERAAVCDVQLKEDLAEAMKEDHGAERRDSERDICVNADEDRFRCVVQCSAPLLPSPQACPLPATTVLPARAACLPSPAAQIHAPLAETRHIPASLARSLKMERAYTCDEDLQLNPSPLPKSSDDIHTEDVRLKNIPTSKPFSESVAKDSVSSEEIAEEITLQIPPRIKERSPKIKADKEPSVQEIPQVVEPIEKEEKAPSIEIKLVEKCEDDKVNRKERASSIEKKPAVKCVDAETKKKNEISSIIEQKNIAKEDVKTSNKEERPASIEKKSGSKRMDAENNKKEEKDLLNKNKLVVKEEVVKPSKKEERAASTDKKIIAKREDIDTSKNDKKSKSIDNKVEVKYEDAEVNKKEEKVLENKSVTKREQTKKDVKPIIKVDVDSSKAIDANEVPKQETKAFKQKSETVVKEITPEPETKAKQKHSDLDEIDYNVCFNLNTITECRKDKKKKAEEAVTSIYSNKNKESLKTKTLKVEERKSKQDNVEVIITEQPHFVDVKAISSSDRPEREFSKSKTPDVEIKTEQQAWDLLINEPGKSAIITAQSTEKVIEDKPRSKRNRRTKFKSFTDDIVSSKVEEDSFVEIHNIIDNQPTCSNDLVSISTCYEDTAPFKVKQEQLKHQTFEIPEYSNFNTKVLETTCGILTESPSDYVYDKSNDFYNISDTLKTDKVSNIFKSNISLDYASAIDFSVHKENVKPRKAKSVSPFYESKRSDKYSDSSDTVIVIDSTTDDFPEIQITRGKSRKKMPTAQEAETDIPVKSWSSIAANKTVAKPQEIVEEECFEMFENAKPCRVSLQDKLMELCKRRDIMVAECDAPSELNFVEEHHEMIDLPPLDALEFALDEFKLEVMRDSLLETESKITSPICKINIDDILCSMKDTSSRALESSSFNYMADFKIVGETRKLDLMDKSSDDDNTSPLASQTDSDKDDKKLAEAACAQPSSKQSKAKKPRKKKKAILNKQ